MNTLIVIFFLSIVIEDYIFRKGRFQFYLIAGTVAYWIFHNIVEKSKSHNFYRKMMMATYNHQEDPTVFALVKLRMEKAKDFINQLEEKTGNKISLTLYAAKCIAEVMKKYSEFNKSLKFGAIHDKKTIDISVLVDVEGKDLASVTLRDISNKSFSQLTTDLYPHVSKIKIGKDEDHIKKTSPLKNIPSFIIALVIELVGFISNLGISFKPLNVQANMMGSVIISNVGGFKLKSALAPLCPFTYTSMVVTLCAIKKKRVLNKDGTITEWEELPFNMAIDHRFIDGAIGAKMIKELTRVWENPETMSIY